MLIFLSAVTSNAAGPTRPILYFDKSTDGKNLHLSRIEAETSDGQENTITTASNIRKYLTEFNYIQDKPISFVLPEGTNYSAQISFATTTNDRTTSETLDSDTRIFHKLKDQPRPTYESILKTQIDAWFESNRVDGDILTIRFQASTVEEEGKASEVLSISIGEEQVSRIGLVLTTQKYEADSPPASAQEQSAPEAPANRKETVDYIHSKFPRFHEGEVLRDGNTIYLFLNRLLQVAPGTVWPTCNEKGVNYRVMVIDKPAAGVEKSSYRLDLQTEVVRDPGLNFEGAIGNLQAYDGGTPAPLVTQLAQQDIPTRTGTLLVTVILNIASSDENSGLTFLARQSFRISDCDASYHVGIMLGVNASFLSTPTNIATSQLANSTNYTLIADDPTTRQAVTVMAIFYPTPRAYGYQYKELNFFQKFNVSVGTQAGPTLLSDVLVGLNYELARGLNFGAGGHYGRHRVIIGQPNFKFGKDIYAGGSSFSEAVNTRMQWDLAWYVGIGIDLRVIGILNGSNRQVGELRGGASGPVTPKN